MKWVKTVEYVTGLSANRAREFVEVLNKENLIDEKSQYVKRGKWSHNRVVFYGKPPLYVIRYYHSTHPVPGELSVYRYDESEKPRTIYHASPSQDYFEPLPDELLPFARTIFEWLQRWFPRSLARSLLLCEEFRRQFEKVMGSEAVKESEIYRQLDRIREKYGYSLYGLANAWLDYLEGVHGIEHEYDPTRDFEKSGPEVEEIAKKFGRDAVIKVLQKRLGWDWNSLRGRHWKLFEKLEQ